MNNEIIIGIGGLILSALTYFAGVYRTERCYERERREKRIDDFVNTFFSQYKGAGVVIEILIPSGINNLHTDEEIKSALENLRNRLGFHPLRNWNGEIEAIGYKKFLNYIVRSGKPLNSSNIGIAIIAIQNS
jgi:hypothetical protein